MIEYKTVPSEEDFELKVECVSLTCDKCGEIYSIDDHQEIQEFHHVSFTGGYSSVFGDGSSVHCDLCQDCLKELIGSFCRIQESD